MAFLSLKDKCRKIVAIGRNYADHAIELGNKVPAAQGNPIIFGKPATSIITPGETIEIPNGWNELHHELELGLVISKTAKNIKTENAMDYISGYVLALDMTGRSAQNELKKNGHPWLLAKGFDTSCPISDFIKKEDVQNVNNLQLKLLVNNLVKQNGNTKDMIFNVPKILEFITKYITLEENDIVLTGTPAGVSAVKDGDVIEAFLSENNKIISSIIFPVIDKPDL